MEQETRQEIKNDGVELSARELVVLANLFLSLEYPHSSMTLEEVAVKLNLSKATAATIMKGLVKKGCVTRVKSFICFYYPVADADLKRQILRMLGLLSSE